MWKVKRIISSANNFAMNYTEIEIRVRNATNSEPWGPTGQMLQDIAHDTFKHESLAKLMNMVWTRMFLSKKKSWLKTYKSLVVLAYLLRNGSSGVITHAKRNVHLLKTLRGYVCTNQNAGKDYGSIIRHKSKEIIHLLQNDAQLRDERRLAMASKNKFEGCQFKDSFVNETTNKEESTDCFESSSFLKNDLPPNFETSTTDIRKEGHGFRNNNKSTLSFQPATARSSRWTGKIDLSRSVKVLQGKPPSPIITEEKNFASNVDLLSEMFPPFCVHNQNTNTVGRFIQPKKNMGPFGQTTDSE